MIQTAHMAVVARKNAGGASSVLKDHEDTDSGSNFASFDSHYATIFTAASSYTLTRIDVFIARNESGSQDFQIALRNNGIAEPGGTVLGTSDTVAAATVTGSFGWITFNFPTPISISIATTYWIDITRGADDLQLYWEFDNDAIPEGMMEGGPGAWASVSAVVVGMFRTYGF